LHNDRRIRIREAQKHVDVVDPDSDPDPQHWSGVWIQIRLWIQILPFSQKDVERTEIKLAKKIGTTDPRIRI
jgi:hypothetical protein